MEFDTYWQNGGYKKISDIIFAECHIFIVSNLCRHCSTSSRCVHYLIYKERYSKVQIENCKSWRIFVLFVAKKLLIWMDVTIFMYIVCRKSDRSCFVKGCRTSSFMDNDNGVKVDLLYVRRMR